MKFWSAKSVLIVVPEQCELQATVAQLNSGTVRTSGLFRVPLHSGNESDILAAAEELVANLRAAGNRMKRCVVALPPAWMSATLIHVPAEIAVEDLDSFVDMELDGRTPFEANGTLSTSTVSDIPDMGRFALTTVAPASRVRALQGALTEKGMHVLGTCPALASPSKITKGLRLLFCIHTNRVRCQVDSPEGVLLWRELALPGGTASLSALAKVCRLALAALPGDARDHVEAVEIQSSVLHVEELVRQWNARHESEQLPRAKEAQWGADTPTGAVHATKSALRAPKTQLLGLPKFRDGTTTVSTPWPRALRGAALFLVLLLLTTGLGVYSVLSTLRTLEHQIATVQPAAESVERIRELVESQRRWFDTNPRTLEMLKGITLAFPELGTVWLNNLEFSAETKQVTLSGMARDAEAWMKTMDKLRATPAIRDLRITQTRAEKKQGESMSFTIKFVWQTEAKS